LNLAINYLFLNYLFNLNDFFTIYLSFIIKAII